MDEILKIEGKFTHIRYRHETTGFTVATFRLHDLDEKKLTVTGILPQIEMDLLYELSGSYVEHERYGMQFSVSDIKVAQPSDTESLIRFFSSSQFPGIGKKSAEKIVEVLGNDAIQKIRDDETVLQLIFKPNDKRIKSIVEGIQEQDTYDESFFFFNTIGLGVRNLMKVQVAYGEEAVSVIKHNPYQLIHDIDGIGFKTADKIGHMLGFDEYHPYRLKALYYSCVLDNCMRTGDSYIEIEELNRRFFQTAHKEGLNVEDFDAENTLQELVSENSLAIEETRVYHASQMNAEQGIASFLTGFPYPLDVNRSVAHLDEAIETVEDHLKIQYEAHQKMAIHTFFNEPLMILTGGPGTGKTTIIKAIQDIYRQQYPHDEVILCAPTGRASKRLAECTQANASTIHRLLKWDLESNTFLVNEKEPLLADCLIIDEFSMVDQWLFYNLLKACRNVRKIMIIGDEDQLPSVGIGCVLKDLIDSNQFPLIRLTKIFRQSEGSDVVALAHEMKAGTCHVLDHAKDVAFFECKNYQIKDQILKIVGNAFDKNYTLEDVQVLAPMYGGVCGIDQLNLTLQKQCNPSSPYKKELRVGYRLFREQDKVLQLKNMPDLDVYNGDIGMICEIVHATDDINHQNRIFVDFGGNIVEYTQDNFGMLTHAYCISIHKSQGSEYPIVILPIVSDHYHMLSLRLVYTAITRAKKSLVILGSREVFEKVIQRKDISNRKTTLCSRIISSMNSFDNLSQTNFDRSDDNEQSDDQFDLGNGSWDIDWL